MPKYWVRLGFCTRREARLRPLFYRAIDHIAFLLRSLPSRNLMPLRHWQVVVGGVTGFAASLGFVFAIGLSAAGPPTLKKTTGAGRQVIDVAAYVPTPLGYEEREGVEVTFRHQSFPAEWTRERSVTPLPAIEQLRLDPPPSFVKSVHIKKGGTLGQALARAGTSSNESHDAIVALRKVFNLRRLRPGQVVDVRFTASPDATKLTTLDALMIAVDVDRMIVAERDSKGNFGARIVNKVLRQEYRRSAGTIEGSLFVAARDSGLPVPLIMELIRIYSWDVDFQREIQRGDRFEVFFDQFIDSEEPAASGSVKMGNILYASLVLSGKKLELFRHHLADGRADYFDTKGASVRKALLRTPINGARLSSRYGKRRHPILGYTKMHRGLDFAAARGTPIMAAGNGVIEMAGRNGAYGKYVRIRHNGRYKTAYAHLSRYGRGIRRGKRVTQGQIIGYVGSTGRSTGPHLHYEVIVRNRQVNPLSIKLPTGTKLKGKQLAEFKAVMQTVAAQRDEIPLSTEHASTR